MKKLLGFIKKLIFFVIFIFISLIIIGYFTTKTPEEKIENMHLNLAKVVNTYEIASLLTKEVLEANPANISYKEWKKLSDNASKEWEKLEKETLELKESSQDVIDLENEEQASINILDTFVFNQSFAVTKEEITSVYDAAPAGRRLRTLANFLNTDAKRAFKVLKMTNEQIKAEAWNQAGDTIETLENSARVIKDSCKVSLLVGGNVLTGGSTTATVGILQKGAILVQKTDLLLEIGQDTASIALGYNDDITVMLKNAKDISGTASAIIGYKGLFKSGDIVSNINKFSFSSEQLNSLIQENKIANIEIDWENNKANINKMTTNETQSWLKENNLSTKPKENKDVVKTETSTDQKEITNKEDANKESTNKQNKQISNEAIVGKWREVSYSPEYLNFIKTEFPDDYQNFDHRYQFKEDGTFNMFHKSGGWKYHGKYEKSGNKWLGTFRYNEDQEGKIDVILTIKNNQLIFKYNYGKNHIIYMEKFE